MFKGLSEHVLTALKHGFLRKRLTTVGFEPGSKREKEKEEKTVKKQKKEKDRKERETKESSSESQKQNPNKCFAA